MPIALRRHSGAEKDPVVRLARLLALSAILIAGSYFAFLYLLTSH